jgi:hypothetical protein
MQAADLRKIHTSFRAIVLDILISHFPAGADFINFHVVKEAIVLDIDFPLW